MTDLVSTSEEVLTELAVLRARVAELEQAAQQYEQLKDELRRREQQFKILVDNAPDVIRRLDRNLRYVYISPAVEQVTGFKPEVFIGKKPSEVGMPLDVALLWETKVTVVFESGQPYSFENVYPTPRGLRYYHTTMVPEYNLDGTIDYAMGITRDITERKLADVEREELLERLEVERGLLEAVVQQMPAGVLIAAAPDNRLLLANEQIKQVWSYPFEPGDSNRPYLDYKGFYGDGRIYKAQDWPLSRSIKTGEMVVDEEIYILRGDGTCSTISVSSVPIRDRDGEIVAGVATVYDISERRQTEHSQQFLSDVSQELFTSLDYKTTLKNIVTMAVPDIADFCTLDIVDDDNLYHPLAVAHVDKAKEQWVVARHSPYMADALSPNPIKVTAYSGQPRLITEVTDDSLEALSPDAETLQFLRDLQAKSAIYMPLLLHERVVGVLTLISTAESGRNFGQPTVMLAEELARRAALAIDNALHYEEARAAVQARDEFLSVAAHELYTPITSLRGFAQLTLNQLERQGTVELQRLRRALTIIDSQSNKLARLVTQLLDVSRLDGKRLTLERKSVDVVALVEVVIATIQTNTNLHTLTLKAANLVTALLDPLRIEQVLVNLVENAIKYSPNGGAVEIEVALLDVETLQIAVTDSGIGIVPEHRPHIFDRFYQGDASTHLGGMGLGLYISHSIVELHGGQIKAEFPPAGGSRFIVTLPLLDSSRQ